MKEKINLKVDWCNYDSMKYACTNWHYSKSIPVGDTVKIGAWENKKFIGCIIFSRGANYNIGKPYELKNTEVCELTRVALTEHKSFVSQILSQSFKFLKKLNPNLKLIVSYADLDQNHHGGIYQATNWVYKGIKNENTLSGFIIKGKKRHKKTIHSLGFKQNIKSVRQNIDPNAKEFFTKGKHKYLMPLTKKNEKTNINTIKTIPKTKKINKISFIKYIFI